MRKRNYLWTCAAVLALFVPSSGSTQQPTVKVAAAADLKFAMAELAKLFRDKTGTTIDVSYGSSGNFFSQIQNGAPFDVFFSADVDYPLKLAVAHAADTTTLYKYAIGRIVIWLPPEAKLDVASNTWRVLLDPAVEKIAIANPQHAPYGRAAVAAMRKANIYEHAKPKLVYGENISQAAQFVQSGSAQAGIIALSLANSPGMRIGKYWLIPAEMHAPIEQAAIVLSAAKNRDGARAFLEFVQGPEGRRILDRFGFQLPLVGSR
jgi:molybdate transport system substrate-binding protein